MSAVDGETLSDAMSPPIGYNSCFEGSRTHHKLTLTYIESLSFETINRAQCVFVCSIG